MAFVRRHKTGLLLCRKLQVQSGILCEHSSSHQVAGRKGEGRTSNILGSKEELLQVIHEAGEYYVYHDR